MTLFVYRIIGFILALFYFPLASTLGFRRSVTNFQKHWEKEGRPLLRCGWHEHILAFVFRHAFRNMCVMASNSKDGELISSALKTLRFNVCRGSSSKGGGDALRTMLRAYKDNWNISLMIDGPRGPRRVIKNGIMYLASMTDSLVIPTIAVVKWYFRVNSWDKMVIPIPFSPSVELNGRPIIIPRNPTESEMKNKLVELENEFKNLERIADKMLENKNLLFKAPCRDF